MHAGRSKSSIIFVNWLAIDDSSSNRLLIKSPAQTMLIHFLSHPVSLAVVLRRLGELSFGPVHQWGGGNLPCQCAQWNRRDALVWHQGGWQGEKKRGNGDDEWGTKNIYPADAPTHHQYFSRSWSHLKKFTCPPAALSVSQRSTLWWMISYGLMIVPADWLSASTGLERTLRQSVEHAGIYRS